MARGRRVARSRAIEPASLKLHRNRLTWLQAGRRRSARF
jgi:hypothetical protein